MEDQHRTNDNAMNARIEWAAKEAAEHAARPIIPDNCIVRDGKVVGTDTRKTPYAGDASKFVPSRN